MDTSCTSLNKISIALRKQQEPHFDSDCSVDSALLTHTTSSPRQHQPITVKLQSISHVLQSTTPIPVKLPSLRATLPQLSTQEKMAQMSQSLVYPEMVQTRALPQPHLKVPTLN